MAKTPKHTQVKAIESAGDLWAVEFADGIKLGCTKAPDRNEDHVNALVGRGEAKHSERMTAMLCAVRDHEAQL